MAEEEKQPDGASPEPDASGAQQVEEAAEDAAPETAEDAAPETAEDAAPETTEDSPPEPESAESTEEEVSEAADEPAAAEDDDLTPKQRRRLERSRASGPPRSPRSPEERAAERDEGRRVAAASRRRHRLHRREKRRAAGPGEGTPPADRRPAPRKVRQGMVVSSKADKTITVRIDAARRHPVYEKVVRRSRTLTAHDESNQASEGDLVKIVETRPMSRTKRWRLLEILERAR